MAKNQNGLDSLNDSEKKVYYITKINALKTEVSKRNLKEIILMTISIATGIVGITGIVSGMDNAHIFTGINGMFLALSSYCGLKTERIKVEIANINESLSELPDGKSR